MTYGVWWLFLASLNAAELQIDARIPAEIVAGGKSLGVVYAGTMVNVEVDERLSEIVVLTHGTPQTVKVDFTSGAIQLFIGRTGITAGEAPPVPTEPAKTGK
ncbi:MAG: hypothetical protein HN348_17545, partial [Proteobacteria bacterium]|nr:hypothetical protein [Pseudomonadota bacterium]